MIVANNNFRVLQENGMRFMYKPNTLRRNMGISNRKCGLDTELNFLNHFLFKLFYV